MNQSDSKYLALDSGDSRHKVDLHHVLVPKLYLTILTDESEATSKHTATAAAQEGLSSVKSKTL